MHVFFLRKKNEVVPLFLQSILFFYCGYNKLPQTVDEITQIYYFIVLDVRSLK